ncbi:MAG TPA: prepilin peptidase [Chthoniobacterales bacterium]|nr:prepilin peptidase [Chthoniobacterales bacterium]
MEMTLIVFSFLIGLVFGSFFGCCIYRLPRDISLLKPTFSFCPACQKSIPWRYNIPLFSWLWLRGRCHECGERISPHYLLVEGITGVFFAIACWRFGFPLMIPIWVFGSLLILTTFIDIEFLLIPDILSKPGIACGIVASLLFPELHDTSSRLAAGGLSISGAVVGGGLLFVISELGKLAFGRYKVILPTPAPFSFQAAASANDSERHRTTANANERERTSANDSEDDARIVIDDEPFRWDDHFFRKTDRIRIRAEEVTINGEDFRGIDLTFYHDRLETTAGGTISLAALRSVIGRTAYAEFPREAMGLGDVKLMAAIGAFTGWAGVLFTIPAASLLGALYGIGTILIGRKEWSSKIPFGPYLAIGAILWIFCGKEVLSWYQSIFIGS